MIPVQFGQVGEFSEGLAAVRISDRWGYIDREGVLAIPPSFIDVEPFCAGLAHVADQQRRWGYIDRSGKYVWHESGVLP